MDLLNFSQIKNEVYERCERYPYVLEYENTNTPFPFATVKKYGFNGELLPTLSSMKRFQKKGQFIYYVIYEGKYHNIEGARLGITDAEIQSQYNKLKCFVEVFEGFEVEDEFVDFIYTNARSVVEEDKLDIEAFKSGPLLNKLTNSGKTFATLKMEVVRLSEMINEINDRKYRLLDQISKREITGSEFDMKMDELEEVYHMFRGQYDYMLTRYKLESERGLQRRRTRLRQCVNSSDLYSPVPVENPELSYTTITRCSFLIEEYCRWKNNRIRSDVKAEKQKEKNRAKREARAINKKNTPQYQLKQERIEIISPLLDEGMSPSQISTLTNIPKSSVQRICNQITGK